jgi:hypothetical protein
MRFDRLLAAGISIDPNSRLGLLISHHQQQLHIAVSLLNLGYTIIISPAATAAAAAAAGVVASG